SGQACLESLAQLGAQPIIVASTAALGQFNAGGKLGVGSASRWSDVGSGRGAGGVIRKQPGAFILVLQMAMQRPVVADFERRATAELSLDIEQIHHRVGSADIGRDSPG